MEAKDLMIGDWVQIVPDAPVMPNEYHRIDWIRTGEIGLDNRKIVTYPYIQPIPLTPEILERNGFVLQEKEVGLFGVTIAPHYTRDDLPFEVFCDGDPFAIWFSDPIDIAYVHQLQHVIRLCGVNQEIVL